MAAIIQVKGYFVIFAIEEYLGATTVLTVVEVQSEKIKRKPF
jgi:hypothetical protein